MSTVFNGKLLTRPQVAVAVDDSSLTPIVAGAGNVIMAFGPALGGEPKKAMLFSAPQDAARVLRGGDLLTAMKRMWAPSDEYPGAGQIIAVRVDPATKGSLAFAGSTQTLASRNLLNGTGGTLLTVKALAAGAGGNDITVTVEAGSSVGKKLTVVKADNTEVYDNLDADGVQATLTLKNGADASLLTLTALSAGTAGDAITAAVAAGTVSGKKVTLVSGETTETYDNLATVMAAYTAIHGVSALVDATVVEEGTLAVISATHLAGGINSALTSVNGVSSLVSLTYVLAGNLATVSTEHLQNGTTAGTVFTLTSLDWGAYVNGIQAKVGEGSDSGYKLTVEFSDEDITEVFDNLADSAAIVAAVNDPASGSMLVSAVKDADGTPSSAVFAPLEDGSDGTTVNQDWSDCFALMGASGADIYDAVTSDTGVIDLLVAAALVVAENHGCMVVAGHAASQTVAQVKAVQAPYAANFRLRIVTPGIKEFDDSGVLVTAPSYLSAAPQYAGLIAGLPIQRPGTFKTLRGVGLERDYTSSELDTLEVSGIVSLENVPGKGIRVVHDQTTWTHDLNAMKREGSVNRIRDLMSNELKADLEQFVGEPGSTYSIAGIKARIVSYMTVKKSQGIITDGVDDQGRAQEAWRNINVSFNSATGVCAASVEASPVTGINYVTVTAHFRATNIVA